MEVKIVKNGVTYRVVNGKMEPVNTDTHNSSKNSYANTDTPIMNVSIPPVSYTKTQENEPKEDLDICNKFIKGKDRVLLYVSEIRHIFASSFDLDSALSLEMLMYMDRILFKPLGELLENVIRYGQKDVSKYCIKKFISNCIDTIDCKFDYEEAYRLIDQFFENID